MRRIQLNLKHGKHIQGHESCRKFLINVRLWLSWLHHRPNCHSLTAIKMLEGTKEESKYRGPVKITEIALFTGYELKDVSFPHYCILRMKQCVSNVKQMNSVLPFIEKSLSLLQASRDVPFEF